MKLLKNLSICLLISGASFTMELLQEKDSTMDEIALKYIQTLSPETQSSIGVSSMRRLGMTVHFEHNNQYLKDLRETQEWFQSKLNSFSGSELHRRELAYVLSTIENSVQLVEKLVAHKFITVLSSPLEDLLNPADMIFNSLNDLVLKKAPIEDVAARFRFYVRGDEGSRPHILAVLIEANRLVKDYGDEGRYPFINYLNFICDEGKLSAIKKELKILLPQEEKYLFSFGEQMDAYIDFVKDELIPRASQTSQLPLEIYKLRLKLYGINADPEELIDQGQKQFQEHFLKFKELANLIASNTEDYPQDKPGVVLQKLMEESALKDPHEIIQMYRRIQTEIEHILIKTDYVTLPQKPVIVRAGTEAEEAIMPVPHVNTPNFIGNNGTIWPEFVLCDLMGNNNPVGAYALTTHEGRPGHDLQFSRMVEETINGRTNLFETVLTDNPTNAEGWAHYVEYDLSDHFALPMKLAAMQMQLLRMARTFLDPQLNLGKISYQDVIDFHQNVIGFQDQTPKSEADRYSFQIPGQAVSYRYGAQKIMDLRETLKKKMGEGFILKRFHDSLLSFGLMPVDLIADLIEERMISDSK